MISMPALQLRSCFLNELENRAKILRRFTKSSKIREFELEKDRHRKRSVWLIGDLVIDTRIRSVHRKGKPIELPRLSYDFLLALAEAAPAALSIDELMTRVWKGVVVSPATVAKRAELLRQALDDDPANPAYIALVRGHGYRLLEFPRKQSEAGSAKRRLFVLAAVLVTMVLFATWWAWSSRESQAIKQRSVAVLPFVDLSEKRNQDWFADGLAEEILNALVRVPDLQVAARTTSFRYRNSDKSVREIGTELGVAYVLEGSVRSTPNRIRVTVQLIRADDGFHVWSDNYDREPAEIITIQEDLASNIAGVLKTSMDPEALMSMARVGTDSVPAYREYLMGLQRRLGSDGSEAERERFKKSYEHFERARTIDPEFFSAHFAAAEFWKSQLSTNALNSGLTSLRPEDILFRYQQRMMAASRNAHSEEDRLLVLANLAEIDLRLNEALGLYEQYLSERPNDDTNRYAAIYTAVRAGQVERGRALIQPWLDRGLNDYEAATLFSSSGYLVMDPAHASEHLTRALQKWPDDSSLLYQSQRTFLWAGRNEEASKLVDRYRVATNGFSSALLELRQACANGDRASAERILSTAKLDETQAANVEWLMNDLLGDKQAVTESLMPLEERGITYQLASLLAYKQFDPRPYPRLMAVLEREAIDRPPAATPPFSCPDNDKE
jgi:TolB-like protein/DNA-binding winged helix-turn-helix (wHTH) protein